MAALLTSTSRPPARPPPSPASPPAGSAARASMLTWSVTSSRRARTSPPAATSGAAARWPAPRSRAPRMTVSPRAASWRATSRPMPRLAPVTTTVSGFTATHPRTVSGASAAHEVGDEAGELDRLVALDAVPGPLDALDPRTGATVQQFGLVGVVDHRLRQHAPHQHQRDLEAGQRIPQRPEVGVPGGLRARRRPGRHPGRRWRRSPRPVAGVAPHPTPVLALDGVVQDPAAQGRHGARGVELDGAGEQVVEAGEALGPVD